MIFSKSFFKKALVFFGLTVLTFLSTLSVSAETLNYVPVSLSVPQYVRCFLDSALFFFKTPEYCNKVIVGYEYFPTLNTIQPIVNTQAESTVAPRNTTNLNSKILPSGAIKSNSNTASFLDETPLLFALRSLLTKEDVRLQLQGPAGPQGLPGPQGNPGSSTTQIATAGYSGITPYLIPSNPANNFSGASLFGVTDLSSTNFISDKATVRNSLTVNGPTQLTSGLTVTGNITGNIIGTLNPSFTEGSIPFQGASALREDNTHLFWDDTNDRLGIGTTSPTGLLHLAAGTGSASTAPVKFTAGTNLTTPEAGALEYNGTSLYFSPSGTRYNLLMNNYGLAGGQTIVGGTAASEELILSSTSNGTKGKILFGSSSAYDEVNDRLGVGNTSPISALNVSGTSGITWGGGAVSSALTTLGTGGTVGGSLWINTPSLNSSFHSGLGIKGSYTSQISTININAYGTRSGGGYGSVLAFSTTDGATLNEWMRIDNLGNVGIGTTTLNQQLNLTKSIQIPMTTTSTTGVIYKGSDRFIHNFVASGTNGNNTFVGLNAGNFTMAYSSAITDASANVGVGYLSMYNNTTGHDNTAIGFATLLSNTTGYWNTAIGMDVLYNNTTGWQNTAMGQDSMLYNTTGYNNVSIGSDSMYNNIDGYSNVSLGNTTLNKNVSGYANTALGIISLFNNTTGDYNTGLGYYSGFTNTTGNNNVFLGAYAGYYETGSNKLFIDNATRTDEADGRVKALVYGVFDPVVANQSFTVNGRLSSTVSVTTPGIASGSGALTLTPASGSNLNIALSTTGDFAVNTSQLYVDTSLGYVGVGTAAPNAKLHVSSPAADIGTLALFSGITKGVRFGTNSTTATIEGVDNTGAGSYQPLTFNGTKLTFQYNGGFAGMTLDTTGFLGIGQTAPNNLLHVGSSSVADATALLRLQDANSTCDFNANASSPSCGSDATLKKDVTSLTTSELLSKVSLLNPVSYRWLTEDGSAPLQNGFIAQEVELQFPDLVSTHVWIDGSQKKFLNTGGLMPYVVGAVKELNIKLEAFTSGVADIFANRVHTKELCVGDGTGSETCITKAQLDALLQGSGDLATPTETPSASSDPVEEDPVASIVPQETAPSEGALPQEVAQ